MANIASDVNPLLENIQRQSRMTHAGVVIAAAAILDNQLERVLKRAMRPLSKAMYGRLFDSFRPMNTFSSKIIVAYALGAIARDVYDELEKIRLIRNEFAHSAALLHFESESIAPKFLALKKPPGTSTKPAEVFVACVSAITNSLEAYLARTSDPQERQLGSA